MFVTNTPAGRLEIFDVTADGLKKAGSVSVGLDPIAVAARNDKEVWVVNHLSDNVSIVDVSSNPPRVIRTLLVGDEPRDVVFAGPDNGRAFITAARRGQNHVVNTVEEMQMPGIGRADVWVFDTANLGASLGGTPLNIVQLFADKPGALTASADGKTVFVSIFTSGNQTTVINDEGVCGTTNQAGVGQMSRQENGPCRLMNGSMAPGGVPGPNNNQVDNMGNPRTGLIVQFDQKSGAWLDVAGRDWKGNVNLELPDNDVFAIDATANPPKQSDVFQHVGTLNKSLAVNPASGQLFAATIEAINMNRFLSAPGLGAFPNPMGMNGAAKTADPVTGKTLNGHLYESRIAILESGKPVLSRHLNKHIDYEVVPSPEGVKEKSISDPVGLDFSPDGKTLFVVGLGTNQIVSYKTSELLDDSFTPNAADHIDLSGNGGPTDIAMTRDGSRMFVYRRFDNAVSTVDVQARKEVGTVEMFNPEPAAVKDGRKFFYDARIGSSNGEANCNVCHPSADKDDLAWDLGTPFFGMKDNQNIFVPPVGIGTLIAGGNDPKNQMFNLNATGLVGGSMPTIDFNPLKGPMTVLTLRGIRDSGPMFWRGDMTNDADQFDEETNFKAFNIVFPALLGRADQIPDSDMQTFTNWALTLTPPPNPNAPLNNQLNASQARGRNIFLGMEGVTDVIFSCENCHGLNPAKGNFGTRGEDVIEGETQFFKVTQLRTVYDKVGMFGQNDGKNGDARTLGGARAKTGPQIRGTGTLHDGSDANPEEFLTAGVFQLDAPKLKAVVDFVFAFPTNMAPIVGQQVTLGAQSGPEVGARVDLFEQRAAAAFMTPGNQMRTECDLVAKVAIDGKQTGFTFNAQAKNFSPVDGGGQALSDAQLRALAQTAGQEVTFTCMYPGGARWFASEQGR